MGGLMAKLKDALSEFTGSNPARVLMLGLDAAGKTTILYKIKLNETVATIPTIGFNVETVNPCKGVSFTVWDVGGQDRIRPLWRHYFQNTEGLLYIIDSNDRERMAEAREELYGILQNDEMRNVPLVVVANKQDLPNALSPSQVAEGLHLHKLTGHKWFIHGSCASTGEGIYESLKEMAHLVKEHKKSSKR
ncbi:ADP-ribosylation factor-like [Mytilus californianus]|uniref:ADP-ribosylation factor-like n=1 Tax=Mytilus californianus TaxID=6549 RepID=UPI002245138B|nr:ADP-ribosylation factor-like [Mytilus californianus]